MWCQRASVYATVCYLWQGCQRLSIPALNNNFKFTWEAVTGDSLPLLDCAVHIEVDRSLKLEVYKKPTHRSILQPLEHKPRPLG